MNKHIYYPEGPANSVQPIALGGTGAKTVEKATDNLGLLTYDSANKAGGPLLLNANGVIGDDSLPDGLLSSTSPLLQGVTHCFPNELILFKVTNFDTFTTYSVSVTAGSVSMVADEITFVAASVAGQAMLSVNGYNFPITVQQPGIQKPAITFPANGSSDTVLSMTLQGSSFIVYGATDSHFSSEWEIATDISFTNVVLEKSDDQINRTTLPTGRLEPNVTYFARVRYIGLNTGASAWSDPTVFTTGTGILKGIEVVKFLSDEISAGDYFGTAVALNGTGDKLAIGAAYNDPNNHQDAGSVELFKKVSESYVRTAIISAFGQATSVSLNIAPGGSIRVLADDQNNFDNSYFVNSDIIIPEGARTLTMLGSGSSGASAAAFPVNQTLSGNGTVVIPINVNQFQIISEGGDGTTVTNPGQPHIAPFRTYTTGPSSSVTINGTVSTFAGGYGGKATPSVKSFTKGLSETTTVTYSIAAGKTANLAYIIDPSAGVTPTTLTLTGASSFDVPEGVTSVILTGKGGAGTSTYHEGQPYIAPTVIHHEGQPYIAPWDETTNPGQPYIAPTVVYHPGQEYIAPTYAIRWIVSWVKVGTEPLYYPYSFPTEDQLVLPAVPDTEGVQYISTEHYAAIHSGSLAFFESYCSAVSQRYQTSAGQPYIAPWYETKNPGQPYIAPTVIHHEGQPYIAPWDETTNPGQEAIAPYYTYTTGTSTTVTANGATYTFAGGYGGEATESSQTATVPSTGIKTFSYSVASGGSLRADYGVAAAVPTTLNLTGYSSFVVPDGVDTVVVTGKGGAGTTVNNPGQDYIAPYTSYTTGPSTTVTYNGTTYTFAGGYGGEATETTKTISVPLTGNKIITYSVASGGSLKAEYAPKTVTGASSTATVNGKVLSFAGGIGGLAPVSTQVLFLDEGGLYGNSCAMSKDGVYLITGARDYDTSGHDAQGAVFIAKCSLDVWANMAFLKASDGLAGDNFGYSVDINSDGTLAIVGSPYSDGSVTDLGAAYVFQRSNDVWSQITKLTPATGAAQELFGTRVSVAGTAQVFAVSAIGNDTMGVDAGAVYVFTYTGGSYVPEKITANDGQAGDGFGKSIKLSEDGTMLFIGAPNKNNNAGVVYVFTKTGLGWTQLVKLTANDSTANQYFGSSLDSDELCNVLVVGAAGNDAIMGAVYAFSRVVSSWTQKIKITCSDANVSDRFGSAISLSAGGDVLAVGSYLSDTAAIDAGSVYIYK